jgi:hypothetical protein
MNDFITFSRRTLLRGVDCLVILKISVDLINATLIPSVTNSIYFLNICYQSYHRSVLVSSVCFSDVLVALLYLFSYGYYSYRALKLV